MNVTYFDSLASLNGYLKQELELLEQESKGKGSLAPHLKIITRTIAKNAKTWFNNNTHHSKGVLEFVTMAQNIREIARNEGDETLDARKELRRAVAIFAKQFPLADVSLKRVKKLNHWSHTLYLKTLAAWIAEKKQPINQLPLTHEEVVELAPYLTYLNITGTSILNETLEALLKKGVNVTHVHLENVISFDSVWVNLGRFQKIEHLVFVNCGAFNLPFPEDVSTLNTLKIAQCSLFRAPLPSGMVNLRKLTIEHCETWHRSLPAGLNALTHLNLIGNNFDAIRKIDPTLIGRLEHFCFKSGNNFQMHQYLQSLHALYQIDMDKALAIAMSNGWSEKALLLYHQFAKDKPEKCLEIIDLIDKITPEKLEALLDSKHPLFSLFDDPVQQLNVFYIATKISRKTYRLLEEYLRALKEKFNFFEIEMVFKMAPLIPNLDKVLRLARKRHLPMKGIKLFFFAYLQFAETNREIILNNLKNGVEAFSYLIIFSNLPPTPLAAKVLSVPNIYSGNIQVDYPVHGALMTLNKDRLLGFVKNSESLIKALQTQPCIRVYVTELMKSEEGKQILASRPDLFLNVPSLQKIITELYPPEDDENLPLYPFQIKFHNDECYLTYLRGIASDHPDYIFDILNECVDLPSISVRQYGSPAVDEGGPGNEFLAELMMGIVQKSMNFTFETNDDGKLLPISMTNISWMDKRRFMTFGILLGIAARLDYPIGDLFSPKLFHTICSFGKGDMGSRELIYSMDDRALIDYMNACAKRNDSWDRIEGILLSDHVEEIKEKAAYLNEGWCDDHLSEALAAHDIQAIKNAVRKTWIEDYIGYFEIVYAIGCGMMIQLPWKIAGQKIKRWNDLKLIDPEMLSLRIQGKLTPEWLKENIVAEAEDPGQAALFKSWIFEWIDAQMGNMSILAKFVQTIIGAPTLSGKLTFLFTSNPDIIAPVAQTCSRTVPVPAGIEKESFLLTLNMWGRGEVEGFNQL